jgi:N utilization substance protein B
MISRRNIRVKVMQELYTVETAEEAITPEKAVRQLEQHLDQSRQLFTHLVRFVTEVARYAETDARVRAGKHLPTAADLAVNTKISGNELLWRILEAKGYQAAVETYHVTKFDDDELVRKTYGKLIESSLYQEYITVQGRDKKEERRILEFIFTDLMLPSDDFIGHLEEHFIHWDDDAEMMNLMMLNFLAKPASYDFMTLISDEKMRFARDLLRSALERKEYCMDLIKPRLKNWDADRIAALDMIIMRLGICEFLYFETIPTKVTINEYIDLAKDYSTPQSGQFVNGILDSVHKDLLQEERIHKVEYKKQ